MSYNSSTGIITAPVSISDVRNALGVDSTSQSYYYDLGWLCTRTSYLNPTARYKPFKYSGIGVQTNLWSGIGTSMGAGWADGDEFNIDGNNHLSARANAAFGTLVPNLTFDSNGFPNRGSKWTANHPTGGSNEPFRLSDFNGYISIKDNCWKLTIFDAPHFAKFRSSQTTTNAAFNLIFQPFKDDGSGNANKYYVSLRDIALTSQYNIDNLYLWISVTSSETVSGYRKLYAKRTESSLRTIFNSISPQIPFNFDLNSNFKPITGGSSNTNPTFAGYVNPSGPEGGLSDINGEFKIQCFIGPWINRDGIVSSIYNKTVNNVIFNSTYGTAALEGAALNCLSLACTSTGGDVRTLTYKSVNWNTGLSVKWCTTSGTIIDSSNPSSYISATKTDSGGSTTYTISTNLKFKFIRDNVTADIIDIINTKVYYKIEKTYYVIASGFTFVLGTDTTTYNSGQVHTVTSSAESRTVDVGSNSIPLDASLRNIKITPTYNYQIWVQIKIYISDSSTGTFTEKLLVNTSFNL